LFLLFVLRSQSFHSSCGGAGYFSCMPKRSNQEKGTPNVAVYGHPALRLRPRAAGFSGRTSLCVRKTRAHRVRDPSDFPPPAGRDSRGPGVERRAPARRSNGNSQQAAALLPALRSYSALRSCSALSSLLRAGARCSRVPAGRGERMEDQAPQGARARCTRFSERTWTCVRKTPECARGPVGQDARKARPIGVAFSLVTFSWRDKRK